MTAPRWAIEGRDWPNRAASIFVDTPRLRWHVQRMGRADGDAPVALLLHGTGAATHSWRDLAPILGERFEVIAPDLPGHGFTSGRPAGGLALPAIAQAIGELLRTIDVRPALIVGHSAGAAIALRLTLDAIVAPAAIVGIGAALLPFPGLAAKLFPTLAKLVFANPFTPSVFAAMARRPGEVARFLPRATGSTIDAQGVEYYRRLFATSGHCAGALGMMADWDLPALAADLPHSATPTLLLHGLDDAAIPAQKAHDAAMLIPRAEADILPTLGHLAHEEDPAAVSARISAFARTNGISA